MKGKKIILGITGSISAYKAAFLVRLLIQEGAEVQVLMTRAAKDFISPLTLSTLSKRPVLSEFTRSKEGLWNNHVDLGLWADLLLIAPASAHTLAKCANGICDNLLIATYMSAKCPVVFAPAMDLDMYRHGSTIENLKKLKSFGNYIIEAETGELASGLFGAGRLAEPEHIVERLPVFFPDEKTLKNIRVLITAGPTQEAIDPVRFISNHSSGKMAYAIANIFQIAGAKVELVSGPVELAVPFGVKCTKVLTANEMYEETASRFSNADVVIFVAAVSDFRPTKVGNRKIKKSNHGLTLELESTPDIAENLGKQKTEKQLTVGFALETDDAETNALAKIKRKNFDLIVLNSLQDKGAGFRYDTNKVRMLTKEGKWKTFELKSKKEVAKDLLNEIRIILSNKNLLKNE